MTARIISLSEPQSAITLQTDGTPLDHGSGLANAFFRGGFSSLTDINDETCFITLKPPVRVNYGSSRERDERKVGYMHFVTLFASEELVVKHAITAKRMFKAHNEHSSSYLGPDDVKPGDRYKVCLQNLEYVKWWHFGSLDGELKDKKFIGSFEEPNSEGKYEYFDDIEGKKPDAEALIEHGWVFSEKLDNLKMTAKDGEESVIIEFVE